MFFLSPKNQQRYLITTAFISGMTIMAIEMTASRLMAPFFGSSVFIWTNLIGVIMLALSIGYWFGGKLADKNPHYNHLFRLIILSSILLFLLPLIGPNIMRWGSAQITTQQWTLVIYSFIISLIIFGIPFIILGMVSPTIIRLLSHQVKDSGKIAGQVYAASTVGSILGTFLPTLLLVPTIGTRRTMFSFALLLLLTGLIGLNKKKVFLLTIPIVLISLITPPQIVKGQEGLIFQDESFYTHVRVKWDEEEGYLLEQDEGLGTHSQYHPDHVYTGSYWDYILLAPYLQPDKKKQNVAIVGVAGGTAIRILEQELENIFSFQYFGSEIDPLVEKVAKKYFQLDYPNLQISNMDGRLYLQQLENNSIDIVFIDAYQHHYIPAHLSSQEFFQLTQLKLTSKGILVININAIDKSTVYYRLLATINNVYPHVWVLPMGKNSLNYMVYASSSPIDIPNALDQLQMLNPNITQKIQNQIYPASFPSTAKTITDDMPLTEVLIDSMILNFILSL